MAKHQHESKKPFTPDHETEMLPNGVEVTSKVKLKAPKQKDGKTVYYTVGAHVDLTTLVDPEGFHPGRFVANIILDKDAAIDPPAEVSIEITQADVDRAGGKSIKVGYHDGHRWVVVLKDLPSMAGFVIFELSKRGDPPIGVAP